jgi:hypothetical protein
VNLKFKNNGFAILASSINSSVTTIPVVDATGLPDAPFRATLLDSDYNPVEIIEVQGKSGNNLTSVLRGQEGTVAASHDSGVRLENRLTAEVVNSLVTVLASISGLEAAIMAIVGGE